MPPIQTVVGLDIGSNTFSCCALRLTPDDGVELLKDDSIPVRLSEGLTPGNPLKPEAVSRGLDALKELADGFDMASTRVKAVATAVLRIAGDPLTFITPAEHIIRAPIEIIDGDSEALYTCLGAVLGMPHALGRAVLDIGGQSTELCLMRPDGEWIPLSMPFGVVSLTEQFISHKVPKPAELVAMRAHIRGMLHAHCIADRSSTRELICVGGTATSLSHLQLALTAWNREVIHGHFMTLAATEHWFHRMASLSTEERISRYGLRPLRADVFLSGIAVLVEVMDFLGLDGFMSSANGLRIGVALSALSHPANHSRNEVL